MLKRIPLVAALLACSPLCAQEKVRLNDLLDPETVALARSIPVQDSGRIKPLDTVARFRLLRFCGMQTIAITDTGRPAGGIGQPPPKPLTDPATGQPAVNEKGKPILLSAIEWLLVSWFKPELAKDLRVFVVDNSDAVIEIGVTAKGKRDRYSYNELLPGRAALMGKMTQLRGVEAGDRSPTQRALAKLSVDFLDFEMIVQHFDFASTPFADNARESMPQGIREIFDRTPGGLAALPSIAEQVNAGADLAKSEWWMSFPTFYRAWLSALMSGNAEQVLRIFPPSDPKVEDWHGPGTILDRMIAGREISGPDRELFKQYKNLHHASRSDAQGSFKQSLQFLRDNIVKAAEARGEAGRIGLEVGYHRAEYFYNALLFFFGGLIVLALSWIASLGAWGRWCVRACAVLMLAGAGYAVTGIVIRCLIMQRPPITTLYETIIFITTASVILGLVAEWMTRKGIALTVACVAGTAGMFISIRFMNMEGTDTMQQLQAVLITNFWLATHVPTINLGYAAGMVAAILSMIYIVLRLVRRIEAGSPMARDLTRIGYGFVMAGLFLSLVGTVLGGIWANYSWGRFWGWDPKENGALMIVLMNLVILHARLGGYVREAGFHCLGIVLGMIVIFSWFGVNELNTGLHNYGFIDGVGWWLKMFWYSQLVLLALGAFFALQDRRRREAGKAAGLGAKPAVG